MSELQETFSVGDIVIFLDEWWKGTIWQLITWEEFRAGATEPQLYEGKTDLFYYLRLIENVGFQSRRIENGKVLSRCKEPISFRLATITEIAEQAPQYLPKPRKDKHRLADLA